MRRRIGLVTPAPPGSTKGNRITALRWAGILRGLGHQVLLDQAWGGQDLDVLIALHARKSVDSIDRFKRRFPDSPVVVVLTGTDLYVDHEREDVAVQRSLGWAAALVALQPMAVECLPASLADRITIIRQSARILPPRSRRADRFDVAVIGHLRAVKDPFLTAEAVQNLPAESAVRVLHVGAALSPEYAARAKALDGPRYRWLGARSHQETLEILISCRLLVLTSTSEGGANVVSEALVNGVPVLSTGNHGSIGMLGADHPGLFPIGDARALFHLLARAEQDAAFYRSLEDASERLAPLYTRERERAAWEALLAGL